nr:TPA_exp: holocytochrome c synthase [Pseudolycopodiella caroliniana]
MGNSGSVEASASHTEKDKSIPEKVHDLYYKAFPDANCPVTGAARDKWISASRESGVVCESPGSCSSQEGQNGGADATNPMVKKENSEHGGTLKRKYKSPHVYDVYGRRIDREAQEQREGSVWKMPAWLYYGTLVAPVAEEINPANRMPKHANQQPAPCQKESLSTRRQTSTIPKGGTEENWLYPSPQMFFNSLVRKGKADDVNERDMEAVVATHNFVNETTWSKLQRWEQLYSSLYPESSQDEPRLLYFQGRPFELSPKARFKKLLGYGVPFDRHDWTVDRGGRLMRYVIDFYYDESLEGSGKWPFFIDVRPALDSAPAVLMRARMLVDEMVGKPGLASAIELNSNSSSSHINSSTDSQKHPAV